MKDDSGFEIYAASIEIIHSACTNEILFEKLRRGDITKDFVHFAPQVNPAEILHLERAIAQMVEQPVLMEIEREETENSVFIDRFNTEWVKTVASLPETKVDELQRRWIQSYLKEEDRSPDWATIDQTETLRQFIRICRSSLVADTDVAMVWLF